MRDVAEEMSCRIELASDNLSESMNKCFRALVSEDFAQIARETVPNPDSLIEAAHLLYDDEDISPSSRALLVRLATSIHSKLLAQMWS